MDDLELEDGGLMEEEKEGTDLPRGVDDFGIEEELPSPPKKPSWGNEENYLE